MRRRVIEEPVNHDRWLVSYADFITLLFAFFVVMYSISQISESKYRVLSNTLTDAFNMPAHEIDPIELGKLAKASPDSLIELRDGMIAPVEGQSENSEGPVLEPGENPLDQISEQIEQAFGDLINQSKVTLRGNEEWLELELSSSLLFGSGDAQLSAPAVQLLAEIAGILKSHDSPVRVEGFTDNVPISNDLFPSNWELSTARAAAVVKLFVEEGIAPQRLAAVGYGEFQPLADNATEEGRARNRRVVLMVSKTRQLRKELPELTEPANQPVPSEPAPAEEVSNTPKPLQGVRTIELKGGGLLFTSEPDDTEAADQ